MENSEPEIKDKKDDLKTSKDKNKDKKIKLRINEE